MTDALCGPSNPLQSLQKHTQVDRTLQQDRLVGNRQSPGQGFRTRDPRAGSLDADFHAFETSTPQPFQFQQPDLFHPQSHGPPAPAPGWAADFQQLSISQQQPVPAGQFRTEAPLIKSTTLGAWQNEFMRQRSGAGTPVAQGKQAVRDGPVLSNAGMFQQSMMDHSQPMYQSYSGGFQQQQQIQQSTMMSMEQRVHISDVDFEAAFADAFAHAQEMDQERATRLSSDPDAMISNADVQRLDQGETARIGSDAIAYREKTERTAEQDTRDADELARTAGQLLTSVSHDNSEKFQNSQFLQLMRKIRDREVEVQGDELQETGRSTSMSTPSRVQEPRQAPVEATTTNSQTSHFEFPDMDAVYAPTNTSDAWSEDAEEHINAQHRYAGSWDYPPASAPQWKASPDAVTAHDPQVLLQRAPYTTYGFDDDQYPQHPQNQFEALHPGGKLYPDQSPRLERAAMDTAEMSGAVYPAVVEGGSESGSVEGATLEKRISASDFDYLDSTWFNFHR
ncbi:uncharacterized protein A1O5_12189 [Cladophialophora psammophila CBS 110553]|uniref:Peroxin 20 n=1 Tax=Cladophialophora psammophila CBS 110553 TaxID=1182543 RepID=W9VUP5_9EURO|nr:uncharacterized protein A1O5_12189 [Cladophialophora psammophila CBS 110553]EXJ59308.1 hypothetical protein A1O5_12189 [Cladophialophora psammophila CBS 110553]